MSGLRGWVWPASLALLVTGLLALAVLWVQADRIESDLADRTRAALAEAGVGASVSFDGRDATLRDVPAEQAGRAADTARGVPGVRAAAVTAAPAVEGYTTRPGLQAELDRQLAAEPVTFEPDSAELTAAGERAVRRVAELLSNDPPEFEVGGHVARAPGGEAAAVALSQERADAVAKRLVAAGVPADRVTAKGYGDSRPATKGDDRRVELKVR
ncbi:OmpA family protein [Amycolatopsis nigrescens]|uniref:OmpA family protein n=1 Tax=Amycolatopsis nigrescens TaxID=381445 RepID=UPI000366AB46|nr:OmpA family protein [Amycolatopsis nigrescens]